MLKDALFATLESEFSVHSSDTKMEIEKMGTGYDVWDNGNSIHIDKWDDAYNYFIKCHILATQKKHKF